MTSVERAAEAPALDPESAGWLRELGGRGPDREAAVGRLHELLLRIARGEARRRGDRVGLAGPELDDLAHQAAADALLAILGKPDRFRGDSRFTTWAYKFVIFEVSAKVGRHFWTVPGVAFEVEDWDRLPGRFGLDPSGLDPGAEAESRELVAALRRAVDEEPDRRLPHQRARWRPRRLGRRPPRLAGLPRPGPGARPAVRGERRQRHHHRVRCQR